MDESQMMTAMECSEEESVCESERNEDWENDDQNQMDFEQELGEEISLESFTTDKSGKSNQELSVAIQSCEIKRQQLEEIMKNQAENIVELQNTCEKLTYTLQQFPTLQEQNTQRYNQVMKDIRGIRQKQKELNELIDYGVQVYDENLTYIHSVKEYFNIQKQLNSERCTVFNMDLKDFPSAGETIALGIEQRIKQKRDYCWIINNHLAELTKSKSAIIELDNKFDVMFKEANTLNVQLLEHERDLKATTENMLKLTNDMQLENNNFALKMVDIEMRESDVSESLSDIQQKIDKVTKEWQMISINNGKMLKNIALLKKKLKQLNDEAKLKEAAKISLLSTHSELQAQINTLSESLSGLTRCRKAVGSVEAEVKSLEDQLCHQTTRASELEKQCYDAENKIERTDILTRQILNKVQSLEREYAKIAPDVVSLQNNYTTKRNELENEEKKKMEEQAKINSAIKGMNKQLFLCYEKFEECRKNYLTLQSQTESKRATIREKHISIAEKEELMKSLNEELEECKVEWNDLIEQKRNASERVDCVKKLEIDLCDGRKELMKLDEIGEKHLLKINKENNRKIEEIIRETENKKQECRLALEEQTSKGSKLEAEYKSLQSVGGTFNNLLKDVMQQAEFFSCEQSLLSTFAKWVFEEEPTDEPWVTSTSGQFAIDGSINENEEQDFQVRDIKELKSSAVNSTSGSK